MMTAPYKHRDAAVLAFAAGVYFSGREFVEGSAARAYANAERLIKLEQWLHLDAEPSLQRSVLRSDLLIAIVNRTYVWLHWPFLILVFIVLARRDRPAMHTLRDALIWSGLVGLVIFAVFPVAPPRFMPGFVGTVSQAERQHFLHFPATWQNRFASVPSFHAGWTLLASIALARCCQKRVWKAAALAPGPLVAVAVVATGNHYVIDVAAGVAISLAAYTLARRHRAASPSAPPEQPKRDLHWYRPWIPSR